MSTITLSGALAAFASGAFLTSYWLHNRSSQAALYWAASAIGTGLGVSFLAMQSDLPRYLAYDAAPLLLDTSAGLTWLAARIFNRGKNKTFQTLAVEAH